MIRSLLFITHIYDSKSISLLITIYNDNNTIKNREYIIINLNVNVQHRKIVFLSTLLKLIYVYLLYTYSS